MHTKIVPITFRFFEINGRETNLKLLAKTMPPLEDVGPQKCLAFSVDGSRLATGGVVSNNVEFLLCYYNLPVKW